MTGAGEWLDMAVDGGGMQEDRQEVDRNIGRCEGVMGGMKGDGEVDRKLGS